MGRRRGSGRCGHSVDKDKTAAPAHTAGDLSVGEPKAPAWGHRAGALRRLQLKEPRQEAMLAVTLLEQSMAFSTVITEGRAYAVEEFRHLVSWRTLRLTCSMGSGCDDQRHKAESDRAACSQGPSVIAICSGGLGFTGLSFSNQFRSRHRPRYASAGSRQKRRSVSRFLLESLRLHRSRKWRIDLGYQPSPACSIRAMGMAP